MTLVKSGMFAVWTGGHLPGTLIDGMITDAKIKAADKVTFGVIFFVHFSQRLKDSRVKNTEYKLIKQRLINDSSALIK